MTIQQVRKFFLDKKLMPCPLTEELVFAGYQQVSGGYIDRAKKSGIKVNYKDNAPSQYWHLMSYCYSREIHRVCFDKIVIAIKIDKAYKIAIEFVIEKGWKESDVEFISCDGEKYLFKLAMPSNGVYDPPKGVIVKNCKAEIITL